MGLPYVIPLVDEGLGNSTYLVDLDDGRALAVDPSRDLRAVRRAAHAAGLRVAFVADTHLHADFLTGAVQLAATEHATVLASAAGGREFPHTGLRDGDEVDLGGLRLRALATPGHTLEHVAFLLLDGDAPVGVFTGGSLLVGAAARTDLVDAGRTVELARAQYASVQRLLTLPDTTQVWPTHGAGSFCSAPSGAERTTTIGREKTTNPLLAGVGGTSADEATFVASLVAGLGRYPPYFARLGEVNRRGPAVVADSAVALAALGVEAVLRLVAAGGQVVDVRPITDYAVAHVPGSVSNPLRNAFATWLGWLNDPDRPILIVRDPGQDPDEIAWQALKIGYENLAGELTGGIDAWRAAGLPVIRTRLVGPDQIANQALLDIRQDGEYAAGHVPGAAHIELGDLAHGIDEALQHRLPAGPVVVMCGHGERAMAAASLLERAGRRDVAVLAGGPEDWAAATGKPLQVGASR
ncbi:MAG: MBL fold metallo-hydrolase [Actinobacteria bacterium]|nr:MBL fold metallo-hydrolase [Actinomycetota bacterium]MBI3687312.1 MBL fold metallo-hydrolase [Actinomycetota bacterium]